MDFALNIPAVLVAALAAFVLGFLWHGPVFGAQWIKMMGIPQAELDAARAKGMGAMLPQMCASYVQHCVSAFVLLHLMMNLRIADVTGAVILGALVWFGFIATTLLNGVLWEKRTVNLYLFNITYQLASVVLITIVVFLMK